MLAGLALHKSWIILVGTFFLGESVVLTAAALAAHGTWAWEAVAAWAFIGTVSSDTVWFRLASAGEGRFGGQSGSRRLDAVAERIDRLTRRRPHRALLVVKFMYGTRVASIVYMAIRRVPVRTFVAFDAVGTALWLAVLVPIGWAIGAGVAQAGVRLQEVERLLLVAIIVGALVRGVVQWRNMRRG